MLGSKPGFFFTENNMSEISSTIRITDGFSEPLKNLAKEAWDADSAITAIAKSFADLTDATYLQETAVDCLKKSAGKAGKQGAKEILQFSSPMRESIKNLVKLSSTQNLIATQQTSNMIINEANAVKKVHKIREQSFASAMKFTKGLTTAKIEAYRKEGIAAAKLFKQNLAFNISEAKTSLYDRKSKTAARKANQFTKKMLVSGDPSKYWKEFEKNVQTAFERGVSWLKSSSAGGVVKAFVTDFGKLFSLNIIAALSGKVIDKLKDSMINCGKAVSEAINNSLDELNLSDKMSAMFGEAGSGAQAYAYALANELGENATMVGEMAAKAAYQGIGTDDFERIMRLADKVGKLSLGETTESAANTLISNVKSGHDASSIAQLFGGGEMMERQLKRSGYERALNRGDLNEALRIAEEVAEQAGLTDEKYNAASNSMSQNYKKIMNVVENIKRRLGEIYVRQLAPIVEKITKIIQSDAFQVAIGIVEKGVEKLGAVVSWLIDGVLNNLKAIGVVLAVGAVAKTLLLIRSVKGFIWLIKIVKFGVIGILKLLGAQNAALALSKGLAKGLGRTLLRIVAPFIAIGAAIAAAVYGIYKLTGTTKSFTGWLKGILAAAAMFLYNIGYNVVTWFQNIPTNISILCQKAKKLFFELLSSIKSRAGEIICWLITLIADSAKNSWIGQLAEKVGGLDVSGYAESAKDWARGVTSDWGSGENETIKAIEEEIRKLEQGKREYLSAFDGVQNAYETEGKMIGDALSGLTNGVKSYFKKSEENQGKIASDTNKIRKINEQEEELRWLKAFSDRQIMSSYSSTTSNSKTVNINGMSQSSLAEMGRRNIVTIPSRAAM